MISKTVPIMPQLSTLDIYGVVFPHHWIEETIQRELWFLNVDIITIQIKAYMYIYYIYNHIYIFNICHCMSKSIHTKPIEQEQDAVSRSPHDQPFVMSSCRIRGSQNLKSQRLSEQGVTQRGQLSCLLVASGKTNGQKMGPRGTETGSNTVQCNQWICLREKLQDTPIFHGSNNVTRVSG
jgi:hypothetical protein